MPSRYDDETKAKAVRLVRDHVGDCDSVLGFHGRFSQVGDERGDVAEVDQAERR